MKKVLTVVGARPQFIKTAVVSSELRKSYKEVLVHTGQHYDYSMSEQFFEELEIPKPDYNLGISGGSHAQMTGKMMIALEEVFKKEAPDLLLLYGDTNSTLSAALSAAKLHIPICHVEAGTRTHCMTNPEEINRICTDHVSSLLLTSTESGMDELTREGLANRSVFVGDPMYDAFIKYGNKKRNSDIKLISLENGESKDVPKSYYYLTCHREENSSDIALENIFRAMNQLDVYTVYPVHPRNKEKALKIVKENKFDKIILSEPVGYLDSIWLVNNCVGVVTDSGGLQREAFFANKKCITVLDFVVWPETMVCNRNQLSKPITEEILKKMECQMSVDDSYMPFGDGRAAEKIVDQIRLFLD